MIKNKRAKFIKIKKKEQNMGEGKERLDVTISFRIPECLKSEMDKIDINWSEFLRKSLEERIELEKLKKAWSGIDAMKDLIRG